MSEYQVKSAAYRETHDGHSKKQVLTEQHRAAHDGKSSYQVQTEANDGMSLFNLEDEKYRAAHKGHSKVQVKRILAQVAEQANSINAQMEGSKQLTDDDSDFAKALSMLDASDGTGGVVEDIIEMASSVFNQERPRLLRRKNEGCMAYGNKGRSNEHSRLVVCEVRKNGHVTGDKVFSPMFGTETVMA
jgi:hypothetical protein